MLRAFKVWKMLRIKRCYLLKLNALCNCLGHLVFDVQFVCQVEFEFVNAVFVEFRFVRACFYELSVKIRSQFFNVVIFALVFRFVDHVNKPLQLRNFVPFVLRHLLLFLLILVYLVITSAFLTT